MLTNDKRGKSARDMCMCAQSLSRVQLLATSWTVAHQAPLSMEFSKQEYRSGYGLVSFCLALSFVLYFSVFSSLFSDLLHLRSPFPRL